MDGSPHSGVLQRNHPMALRCLRVGAVHSINLVPFFAVLWSMAYGFIPNAYQIVGGLVALSGVVYMQWRKLQTTQR